MLRLFWSAPSWIHGLIRDGGLKNDSSGDATVAKVSAMDYSERLKNYNEIAKKRTQNHNKIFREKSHEKRPVQTGFQSSKAKDKG